MISSISQALLKSKFIPIRERERERERERARKEMTKNL